VTDCLFAAKDAPVVAWMHVYSARYPRWGYRRVRILLGRDGMPMSPGRAHRPWKKAELQVPKKRRRRRLAASRPRPHPVTGPNQVWAYDFVLDACANGQKLKCLTVVDEWTHEALAIDVGWSIRSTRVIEILDRLVVERDAPETLRSDNGPEFVSLAVLGWLSRPGVKSAFIAPGKPWQNATNESFNRKFRDECLNMHWFSSRAEARVRIEQWRREYNEVRPHSSIAYLTPAAFRRQNPSTPNPGRGEVAACSCQGHCSLLQWQMQ
jgi:putative transposase